MRHIVQIAIIFGHNLITMITKNKFATNAELKKIALWQNQNVIVVLKIVVDKRAQPLTR
jgi:hypothetical protein